VCVCVCVCYRLCGKRLKKTVITTKSNKMTIKFKSDASYVDVGFIAEYEAFVPTNRKREIFSHISQPPVFGLLLC